MGEINVGLPGICVASIWWREAEAIQLHNNINTDDKRSWGFLTHLWFETISQFRSLEHSDWLQQEPVESDHFNKWTWRLTFITLSSLYRITSITDYIWNKFPLRFTWKIIKAKIWFKDVPLDHKSILRWALFQPPMGFNHLMAGGLTMGSFSFARQRGDDSVIVHWNLSHQCLPLKVKNLSGVWAAQKVWVIWGSDLLFDEFSSSEWAYIKENLPKNRGLYHYFGVSMQGAKAKDISVEAGSGFGYHLRSLFGLGLK